MIAVLIMGQLAALATSYYFDSKLAAFTGQSSLSSYLYSEVRCHRPSLHFQMPTASLCKFSHQAQFKADFLLCYDFSMSFAK